MRDALQEVADYPEEREQLDESLLGLLRTAAIAVNVRNSVSSGKKVQSSATELRQIGKRLKRDKTQKMHKRRLQRVLSHLVNYWEILKRCYAKMLIFLHLVVCFQIGLTHF